MQSVSTGDKPSLARVACVQKGRGGELGRETAREGGGRRVPFLFPSRAQIPPSPSPFNTCHAGQTFPNIAAEVHRVENVFRLSKASFVPALSCQRRRHRRE